MDPELEAFIALFPPADPDDPATAGQELAATWRHDLDSQASLSAAISQRQHPDLTTTLHRALAD